MKTDGESRTLQERERLALAEQAYWKAREDYGAALAAKADGPAVLVAARALLAAGKAHLGETPGFAALSAEVASDCEMLGVELEPKKKGAKP
jgi:hypothetical protein